MSSSAPTSIQISAIVPTLGASPWLEKCLRALRDEEGASGELEIRMQIVVVCPAREPLDLPQDLADLWLETGPPLGFAAATNRGIGTASGPWIATVNDDLILQPGWASRAGGSSRH